MGIRLGTAGDALTMKRRDRMSGRVSKSRVSRKNATYLKLEKPHFLFLEGRGHLHHAYCGARWHLHR
jgi:hypothetical protein